MVFNKCQDFFRNSIKIKILRSLWEEEFVIVLRLGLESHVAEEKSTCFVSVNISSGLLGQNGKKKKSKC